MKEAQYLLLDVVKRVGGGDGEANQDDVRVRVGEGTETVIIFLASRIPQGQLNVLAIDLDVGDIVLENGGDVDLACALAKRAPTVGVFCCFVGEAVYGRRLCYCCDRGPFEAPRGLHLPCMMLRFGRGELVW